MRTGFLAQVILTVLFSVAGQTSAAEKVLDIPYSHQSQAFTCGHESLRMVLAYWGKRESREKILMRLGANGSTPDAIEGIIKRHYPEFKFEVVPVDFTAIKTQIDLGRPIMFGADASNLSYLDYDASSGHMIVLVGYDDVKKIIYIRDPNSQYVEELTYDQLHAASLDDKRTGFVVYKPNVTPASGPAKNFDEAFPVHTAKKKNEGIPLTWILPAFHLSYETEPRLNLPESMKASSKQTSRHFTLSLDGFSHGHQTMEQTPWLGAGKIFRSTSFGAAWVMGTGLRLGPNELVSPGIYSFGRQRILEVHNFSSIKSIPSLNLAKNTFEVAGYYKPDDNENLYYDEIGVEAISWRGARLAMRRGVSQSIGHLSAGLSAGSVDVKFDGKDTETYRLPTLNYDLNLGIIKGSVQTSDLARTDSKSEKQHDGFSVRAYSLGVDYYLGYISSSLPLLNAMNYIGIFRPHVEVNHEIVRRESQTASHTVTSRKWEVELPVPLHFVDMSYGGGITQRMIDNGEPSTMRSAWVRFAFNAYLPYVQLTTGYRVNYERMDKVVSQQMSFGMFAGI